MLKRICVKTFQLGSRADRVFFISSGTVAVINSNDEELAHLEDGDELGLTSAFQSHPYIYNYSYYTVETTEVYCITKKDFRYLVVCDYSFSYNCLHHLQELDLR